MQTNIISKSTFLRGIQCYKSLFLNTYHRDLLQDEDRQQKISFKRGVSVGRLARNLFPGGVDLTPENYSGLRQAVKKTSRLIDEGKDVLYEAAFQHENVFAALDILVKDKDKWNAYEVKSSTGYNDIHVLDAALQYYVMSRSGTEPDDFFLVHINNEYIRQGNLELDKLFIIASVVEKVRNLQDYLEEQISAMQEMLGNKSEPEIEISEHCYTPYDCDFIPYCWKKIPENSVFDIRGMSRNKKFEFYNRGIVRMQDIPEDAGLNKGQLLQVNGVKNDEDHVEEEQVRSFLETIPYPLYFLDFESFQPVVPIFNGTKPYERLAFQYSLHYQEMEGEEPIHFEFLGDGRIDPRKALIEQLMKDTENEGLILVFNQTFEKTVLKDFAEQFPEFRDKIQERIERVRDLMSPFQKKIFYTRGMKGSYSIKNVLPALVPDPPVSYDKLKINNGALAMEAYESLYYEDDPDQVKKVRESLLKYCGLDTLAMLWVLDAVKEKVSQKQV